MLLERDPEKLQRAHLPTEKWMLEHGHVMGPRIPLPDGIKYGKAKECFGNAFGVAAFDERYRYCEGWAYTPGLIAVHHAWLIDLDGNVIDPTWRDGGHECAFCDGEGSEFIRSCDDHPGTDIDECGCDEEEVGYVEDERDCAFCRGTGRSDHEHPSREGTEYFGIAIEQDELIRLVMKKGTYGVLPDCIPDLKKEAIQ